MIGDRWKGMPRTKRTHKPEKNVSDMLSKIRAGKDAEIKRENGMVSIRADNKFFLMSERRFDEFMDNPDVNIRIAVYENINVGD